MVSTITAQHPTFTSLQGKVETKEEAKEAQEKAKSDLTRDFIAQAFTKLLMPFDQEEGFMGSGPASFHFMDFLGRGIVEQSTFGVGKKIAPSFMATSLLNSSGMTELLKHQGESL